MEHQWYVLQVFSNYEQKIQRTLTDRIEITGLQSEITDAVSYTHLTLPTKA